MLIVKTSIKTKKTNSQMTNFPQIDVIFCFYLKKLFFILKDGKMKSYNIIVNYEKEKRKKIYEDNVF